MTFKEAIDELMKEGLTNLWTADIWRKTEVLSMYDKPEVERFLFRYKDVKGDNWEIKGRGLYLKTNEELVKIFAAA